MNEVCSQLKSGVRKCVYSCGKPGLLCLELVWCVEREARICGWGWAVGKPWQSVTKRARVLCVCVMHSVVYRSLLA